MDEFQAEKTAQKVQDYLEKELINTSYSPVVLTIILVKKRTVRTACIWLYALNKSTVQYHHLSPWIADFLASSGNATVLI